jgi:exosortase O
MSTIPTTRPILQHNHDQPADRLQLGLNLAIIAVWLWLYWPLYDYLNIIFSREDFRTNQLLLLGIVALIAHRLYQAGRWPRFDAAPCLTPLPLALALGGSLLYLLAERFLNVNTLSTSLFGLASYGLLGLWLAPARWRQGLPAALLLIGTLPFGDHLQTFVGYPLRILTAAIVRDGLAALGVVTVGIDTILVFENGVSQVDLPCSGVKSLWTGALFLLAATWVEQRPFNRRWLGTAVLFALLLFLANLARVAILVGVGEVLGWRLLAEMLHVPLGVLGFVAACAAAVWLLRRTTPFTIHHRPTVAHSFTIHNSPGWLAPLLVLVIAMMALTYTPRPQTGLSQAAVDWPFPAEMHVEPLPLKADELAWLTRDGADAASRYRFAWGEVSGSMILITSHTWRAHHRPERCFEVYGLSLEESRTLLIGSDFPLRQVSLGSSSDPAQYTAAYWFQSATQTTDDYATRIWADLSPERQRWVLVTILFDENVDPHRPDVQSFYLALHETVAGNRLSVIDNR